MEELKGKKARIIEVGPRDGLQNEKQVISTSTKFEYLKMLTLAGFSSIEVTSFVSSKSIPQMFDSSELYAMVRDKLPKHINYPVLVPNTQGLESALSVGVNEIALFSATSDLFTKKNINCSVDESFERMEKVAQKAKESKLKIRGYVSTAFGCPYQGKIELSSLINVVKRFFDLGVYEVSIGDTIGVAVPEQVKETIKELKAHFDLSKIAMHFHDTRGMALTNTLVSLEGGIFSFDSASAGLGGCPYAKGSSGNVATEDLIYLFDSLGIKHGLDLDLVAKASAYILDALKKETSSKFLKTYLSATQV